MTTVAFTHALSIFNPEPVTFWEPYPKQATACDLAENVFELLYGGAAGGGKGGRCPDRAAPSYNEDMETKVLTPKGWKLFGDVAVGDSVCNPDSTTATVIRVTENGLKQFYRITLADGSTVEADEDHLWAISVAGTRKRRADTAPPVIPAGLRPEDEWNLRVQSRCRIVNTVELMRLVARADDEKARGLRPHYVQIPLANPVALTHPKGRWPVLSPYILGALIGDGSLGGTTPHLSGIDEPMFERVRSELPSNLHLVPRTRPDGSCITYGVSHRNGHPGDTAGAMLRRDGLMGLRAWEKFIPERIKWAPIQDRFAFVQGLMDTDGHMDERGHVEFTSVSRKLVDDLRDVLHSLGYRATVTGKTPTYEYKGEKLDGRYAWRLYTQGRHMDRLFHMPRKRERAAQFNGGDVEPWHRVVSVTPTAVDNSRCITVDNLNHLYVTDDYIVTHNSAMLRGYACDFAANHPGAHIAIVRRTLPQLRQTHGLHLPGVLDGHAIQNRSEWTWTFPNGAIIRFISLPNVGDEQNYKSAEFDLLLVDEVTELEESQYTFMLSRVRSARGHRAHVIATANPEGRGFRWVKRRWVEPRPEDLAEGQTKPCPTEVWAPPVVENGQVIGWHPLRAFLPATVYDNPGLMRSNPGYVQQLMALPDGRLRRALLDGDWSAMDSVPGALWSQDVIDEWRVTTCPDLIRVVTGVDPSGTSQSGDRECGIMTGGIDRRQHVYITVDSSGPLAPDEWAARVAQVHASEGGDKVVAERNYGGEMVESTLRHAEPHLPVELITSSRGKALRAEPIAALTKLGRIHFVGRFPDLEDQMVTWTQDSGWSPDRLDAMIFCATELLGGASALAFLTQLSAPCPECKAVNHTNRPTCLSCGATLPAAADAGPALPADAPPVELAAAPLPGPTIPGTVTIGGLILPAR
jgi:Terminase large subunit, T4likevirus-type, N-terminal/LAGLIDADG-like domain/Terminase RNaseH-like domain